MRINENSSMRRHGTYNSILSKKSSPNGKKINESNQKQRSDSAGSRKYFRVNPYKHLCKAGGKDYAEGCIRSLQHLIQPRIQPLSSKLIMEGGILKCQYSSILSYNDAIIITLALENNPTLHTSEKNLPKIKGLRLKTYAI